MEPFMLLLYSFIYYMCVNIYILACTWRIYSQYRGHAPAICFCLVPDGEVLRGRPAPYCVSTSE